MDSVERNLRGKRILVRHEGHTPREKSACGWRDRLISREDGEGQVVLDGIEHDVKARVSISHRTLYTAPLDLVTWSDYIPRTAKQ